MATYVRREIRKRGFFGWIFLILFWCFNAAMLAWLLTYWGLLSNHQAASDAEQIGRTIGGTIGSGIIVSFWGFGAIILGLFVLLTRGAKTIFEDHGQSDRELERNIRRTRADY